MAGHFLLQVGFHLHIFIQMQKLITNYSLFEALLGLFTHLVWSLVFLNHPDEIPFDFFCHMDCVVSDWMEMVRTKLIIK